MTRQELIQQIREKQSFLCVGLDPDLNKMPEHLLDCEDPIFEFNKKIIDATAPYAVAYKPNTAFYEVHGAKGWMSLEKTINYIPKNCFIIADAKRGDIGNTSSAYAKAFFETLNCDAVTVAPYMGKDSVQPFLEFEGKWAIVLALTSNQGAVDFQHLKNDQGAMLYQQVLKSVQSWGHSGQLMFVIGADKTDQLKEIRQQMPEHFFLVPGVGAQGGTLKEVFENGASADCGLLVNSSRGIIYGDTSRDFEKTVKEKALKLQSEMALYLQRLNF